MPPRFCLGFASAHSHPSILTMKYKPPGSEINKEFAAALVGIGSARHRCWHRKARHGDVIDQGCSGTASLIATADVD